MATDEELHKKLKDLQQIIGKSPKVEIEHLTNWSTSRKIENLLLVKPKTLTEVQNVVKAARSLKLQLRCGGALHSWAPLFPDEGNIMMQTQDLKRHDGPDIELIKVSEDDIRVNVMSGTTAEQLMVFELKNKVNLTANVVLTEPTYGGIVGAGCHGVGWDFKSVSDFCLQMRIIDSKGELRTFSKADDPDMMAAVQCNLGMFGIIYDMQLQVIPEKIVHAHNDFSYNAEDLFYDPKKLKDLVESNESVEIFYWPMSSVGWIDAAEQITRWIGTNQTLTRDEWNPKEDGCWVRKVNIPDQSTVNQDDVTSEFYYKYLDIRSWLESKASTIADDFIIRVPEELTPLASKAAYIYAKESNNGDAYQQLVNAIHFRQNINLLSVSDMEWAFDTKGDFSNVTKAVQSVIKIVQDDAERGHFPLNIVIEMRWMSYSEAYLCPAMVGNPALGGSGHTIYIEVLSYTGTPGWDEFSQKVAKAWMQIPGARPHWAKEWDNIVGMDTYLKKIWSKQIKQFTAALDRSQCDPDGIFLNNKLHSLFYPNKKLVAHEKGNADTKTSGQSANESQTAPAKEQKKSGSCRLL